MRRLITALLCLAAGVHALPQAAPISGQVLNQYGQPVAGANVRICSVASTGTPCTPTVTIYQDYGLTTPTPNPTQTDANGNFNVFVGSTSAPNIYIAQATPQSGTTYTWTYIGPPCLLSGCTFTGPITAPTFNATQAPYYQVNGVQIACANLSDCSNLAKINASNTFTGSPQTAPVFNATSQFTVNGVQIAASNLSNGVTGTGEVVLQNNAILITPNIGAAIALSLSASGNVTAASLGASANVTGTIMNALTGFRINTAAPTNHVLVGNGTNYVDSATIPAAALVGSVFYQTIKSGTSPETQRDGLSFDPTAFTLSDNSLNDQTQVTLNTSGVTAGSYTCANISVNAFGITTGAANGGCSPPFTGSSGYQVLPSGLMFQWGDLGSLNDNAASTGSLPIPFPHACFNAVASENEANTAGRPGNPRTIAAACNTSQIILWANGSGSDGLWMAIGW